MKTARKQFVAPKLKEQASLAKVTLISGGGPTNHGKPATPHGHHS